MPEILRLEMNVPAQIALEYPDSGKRVAGRYGEQVLYTLTDDRVIYVPPIVAGRIAQLGIQPREVFQICKRYARQGCRRLIDWEVNRLAPDDVGRVVLPTCEQLATNETVLRNPPAVPPQNFLELHQDSSCAAASGTLDAPEIKTVVANENAVCSQETKARESICGDRGIASKSPSAETKLLTSKECSNGLAPAAKSHTDSGATPPTKLEHALKTAISAAYNAERFGAELGYVVRFDADAIKSMAITVLINMNERAQR